MKVPKIIILTNLFPNMRQTERGVFIYQMVRELKKRCNLLVISPLPWLPKSKYLLKIKKWSIYSNIPYHDKIGSLNVYYPKYFLIPKIGQYFQFLSYFLSVFPLVKKIKQEKVKLDAVNAHWAYPDGVAAAMIAHFLKIPLIISVRGSDINRDIEHKYFKWLITWSLKKANAITTVSTELKTKLVENGIDSNKIKVINNGIDTIKFPVREKTACRKNLNLNRDEKYILFVGRLEHVKGLDTLVDSAIYLLTKNRLNFKTLLVGSGSIESSLKRKISDNNLDAYFYFAGSKNHNEVGQWIGASDLLCLPSLNEGHPNVVMEALSSGRPVVASQVGETPNIVTSKSGRLFPPGDHIALAESLLEAIKTEWDPDIVHSSISEWTWEKTAKRYFNQIAEAINDQ